MSNKRHGWFVPVSALCHGTFASIVAAVVLLANNPPFEPVRGTQKMIVIPAIPLPQVRLSWTGVGVSLLNTFLVASLIAGILRAACEWLAVRGRGRPHPVEIHRASGRGSHCF